MRAFLAFFAAGFRRWSAYRAASVAGAFTNSLFGLVKSSILIAAVGSAGGVVAGYSAKGVATNAWLVQSLLAVMSIFAWSELAERVRTGDIAVDLARPVDLQLSWLAADLGRAAFVLLPRGLPPLVLGALTTGLALPGSPWAYVLGLLSVVIGASISFAGRFLMNLVSFWLLDFRGVVTLYMVVATVLSGLIIPVHWFPSWLALVADLTWFPSMLQTPVDVLQGRATGLDALALVGVQCVWLAVTLLAGRLVLSRATRRLVVQGG